MTKKYLIVIGGLLAALLVVGVIGTTNVYAQSSDYAFMQGRGPGGGHRGLGEVELKAAADALDMTTAEVTAALQSGKTLEDLAEAAGVEFETVQAAIHAAHAVEMRERIQAALADGTITQANANWLIEGLDQGFIGVPGGFGFGGSPEHGHGGGKGPLGNQANP